MRSRTGSRPRLTDDDKLLVLAQATVGSYLRYGAYPYAIGIREYVDGGVIEHRFVGLLHGRRDERRRTGDPVDLAPGPRGAGDGRQRPRAPGPVATRRDPDRPPLGAVHAQWRAAFRDGQSRGGFGIPTRALLFVRADRLRYFVSCLVYLPRDRYTTAVRLQIEDILVREFGGTRLEFTARVSESPWALMHFMVRLPEHAGPVDVSETNRMRIQALVSEAARTWSDRLIGAAPDRHGLPRRRRALRRRILRGLQIGHHARRCDRPHRHHQRAGR